MHLFVIGAGPVGLVTAAGLNRLGHRVTVSDIDAERVAALAAGRIPFFERGLEAIVRAGLDAGTLDVTTDARPPAGAAMSIVSVPTPGTDAGSLSMAIVLDVVRALLATVPAEHVIAIRSTMPLDGPDQLEALVAGREHRPSIVSNPEFMREGNAMEDFERPSRVVTGFLAEADRPAAEAVANLYAGLGATTLVTDMRSAALVKLGTNVFLGLKIGFANELARLADAMDADVEVVTRGIGLDPRIGAAFLRPGPGFGGSCLPEQAVAIGREAAARGVPVELLAATGRMNDTHRQAIVDRIATLVAPGGRLDGCRIAVLGLAFKAGTDDVRSSPGLAIARELAARGAEVVAHDPLAAGPARAAWPDLETRAEVVDAVAGSHAVVVTTEWPVYGAIDWAAVASSMRGELVYDTRAIVDGQAVRDAGLRHVALGRPAGS